MEASFANIKKCIAKPLKVPSEEIRRDLLFI